MKSWEVKHSLIPTNIVMYENDKAVVKYNYPQFPGEWLTQEEYKQRIRNKKIDGIISRK